MSIVTHEFWNDLLTGVRGIWWVGLWLSAAKAVLVLFGMSRAAGIGSAAAAAMLLMAMTLLAVTQTPAETNKGIYMRLLIIGAVVVVIVLMFPFGIPE